MDCGHCRTENPGGFRHCGACGQRLAATRCDACGFSTPAPFTHCGNCGVVLDLHRGVNAEERRFATVVFADVVGFTKLAEDTDPEDTARIVDAAFRQLSEVVVDHGGTIDKYIGDSLMAVFGIPFAHQDDAERAVAAALAMQRTDTGLGFAIGVNTGEVMVTALGGGANTVMGDTVNVAARLEKAAKEGEVLVGAITHQLTAGRINYRERPPLTLKGKRDPVELYQAMSIRSNPTPSETPQVPMVGRVEELDFLYSQWRRACSLKRLATVLLTGDAGIGKSRLLDELVNRIGDEALIVRSSYPPYGGSGGMRVGGDLLAQLGPSTDEAVQRRVRSLAGDLDPSLRDIDAGALRKEQLWALRRLAEDSAKDRPIVVLIEDVHMASTSIDLLTGLVAQLVDLPMMVVLAGRPEGRWLTSFPTASTVRLRSLTLEGSRRLAELWQPGTAEPDEDLLSWAGGNPLFLRELLVFSSLHGPDSPERQQLPVSLRAVLAARLDTLASAERAALQDFAVIGDTATVEQLMALGGPGAVDGIKGLTNSGVVRHRPDGTLRITEPLLREVAYETMPRTTRVERHVRMAELLTNLDDRARHLSRASEHALDDGHLRSLAAEALALAGLDALEKSRRPEGVSSLRQAVQLGYREPTALLRLASALNDSDRHEALRLIDQVPLPSGNPRIDAERTLVLANALTDIDSQSAFAAFDDAITRWQALEDRTKEGWAHSNKGVALFMVGRTTDSDAELVVAVDLFRSAKDRTGELAALSFRSLVRPDHPDVEIWMQESLTYAIELGDRSRQLAALTSLQWHHYLALRLGGPQEALAATTWIETQIAMATDLGWLDSAFQGLCLRANLARYDGNFAVARTAIDQARELGPREGSDLALLQSVEASLDPGRPLRPFTGIDPITNLASVIQMETAFLEGRFAELVELQLVPNADRVERPESGTGLVIAAAGMASIQRFDLAQKYAREALAMSDSSKRWLQRIAAESVLSECESHQGRPGAPTAKIGELGGLVGVLVARAWAAQGNDDALAELSTLSSKLRAPGIELGITVAAAS